MQRLSANSPEARQLRQEVHFACPVCANIILTYHHFDPTWKEREHNDVAGVIALCPLCHGEAEGGRWTKRELHDLKRNAPLPSKIRKDFPWRIEESEKIIYRLGGNYAASESLVLALNGRPLLREERSPEGLALFSLDVLDAGDEMLLQICQNSLTVTDLDMWDIHLTTDGNRIVVRPRKGEVALDLRLRRMTLETFAAMVEKDCQQDHMPKQLVDIFTEMGLDKNEIGAQQTAKTVKHALDYARKRCLDSDDNLVLVDIHNSTLYAGGKKLIARDGLRWEGGFIGASLSFDNGGAAFSL